METMFSPEEPLGKHLIVEFYGCNFDKLNDEDLALNTFKQAVKEANMTLLNLSSHKFQPFGLTALALLSESHLSIHTYPELGYAAVDAFTCGKEGDPYKAIEVLKSNFQPKRVNVKDIKRGIEIIPEDLNQDAITLLKKS